MQPSRPSGLRETVEKGTYQQVLEAVTRRKLEEESNSAPSQAGYLNRRKPTNKRTLLHELVLRSSCASSEAEKAECLNIARLLLSRGAKGAIPDLEGRTPLHWAAYVGDVTFVSMLLHYCPEQFLRSYLTAVDAQGRKAWDLAAYQYGKMSEPQLRQQYAKIIEIFEGKDALMHRMQPNSLGAASPEWASPVGSRSKTPQPGVRAR